MLGLIVPSVPGLSAAGIYAMMSLTVTQRRREIGIRAAPGADPRRIVSGALPARRAIGGWGARWEWWPWWCWMAMGGRRCTGAGTGVLGVGEG